MWPNIPNDDAGKKAGTMRSHRVPGVNNLGKFGGRAFAAFTAVYETGKQFDKLSES